MVIRIEIEHAVKSGKEKEVLSIIQELKRKGLNRPASALWREMLSLSKPPGEEYQDPLTDNHKTLAQDCLLLLDNAPKVKLRLSA
ncbi:MAG: hypothetical protein R6U37_04245 [Dehalococcoidia bacterium]